MFSTNSVNVPSLADIAAVTDNNGNDGMWSNGGWWVILIILVAFGWGGNGFGGFGSNGAMSTFNTDYIAQGLRDIQGNLASNFLTLNNETLSGICDIQSSIANGTASVTNAVTNGFNTQNLANLQNTNAIQRDINASTVAGMQNTYALQATMAQMASDNRADTAQIAYNQATNTCALQTANANNTRDIIDAITTSNRAVLDAMAQNKVEAMQDKINDLQSQLQTANFLASQAAQNQYLVDELRPSPEPAYVVPNPYAGCGCNSCGCGYN